jgi:hypothetical protein
MRLDKDYVRGVLPIMLEDFVKRFSLTPPLTEMEKEFTIKKTLQDLEGEIENQGNGVEIENVDAHLLKLMIRTLSISKVGLISYFNSGMDWWEAYIRDYIRNIMLNHKAVISECLMKFPDAFSNRDLQLWNVFMNNQYANSRELADKMGMPSANEFNQACHGLIHACFNIYKNNRFNH